VVCFYAHDWETVQGAFVFGAETKRRPGRPGPACRLATHFSEFRFGRDQRSRRLTGAEVSGASAALVAVDHDHWCRRSRGWRDRHVLIGEADAAGRDALADGRRALVP